MVLIILMIFISISSLNSVKKDILPTIQSLCQDVNSDVRAHVCVQLRYVSESLGDDTMKLLPFFVELASDEASNVRQAAVQTIGYFIPHLQTGIQK